MAADRLHLPTPVCHFEQDLNAPSLTLRSHQRNMSLTFTIPPILSLWEHVTVYYQHAQLPDTPWRAGQFTVQQFPFLADVKLTLRCHLGNSIIYDTVTKWNWSVDVRTHSIKVVIDKLLGVDWDAPQENGSVVDNGTAVPTAKPEAECVVRKH